MLNLISVIITHKNINTSCNTFFILTKIIVLETTKLYSGYKVDQKVKHKQNPGW